jgi:uncharacterized membrane protein
MTVTHGYLLLKSLHILGVVVFLGNIITTAWWKLMAGRDGDPRVVAFAQRQVVLNDFVFTATGVALVLATGIGITALYRIDYLETRWFAWGYWLFIASAAIWFAVLVPVQRKQAAMARLFAAGGTIPESYWRLERVWVAAGTVAILLPLANTYWMIFKPS